MKKALLSCILLFASLSLLAGCSGKDVSVGKIAGEFTNIRLEDEATGNYKVLDKDITQEMYSNIKGLEFTKTKVHKEAPDEPAAAFLISFLKETREPAEFAVINKDLIKYDGDYYKARAEGFDLEYLMSFFYDVFEAEVMEAGERLLIAPDKESSIYKSSDKISAAINNALIFDESGAAIEASQLKPGDMVRVAFSGVIAESYPAQIDANRIDVIGHNQIIDGYMALIEDIYNEDTALNGDITTIAFDTTGWIEVNDIEKEIILSLVSMKYKLDTVQGTFDELAEQGLINRSKLYFEKGILIEIKNMKSSEDRSELQCSISKWRSGLGAIGWDARAEYNGSRWIIRKDNQWIS